MRPAVIGSVLMAAAVAPAAWALRTSHAPAVVELAVAVPLGVAVYGAVIWLIHRRVIFDLMTLLRQSVRVGRGRRLGEAGGGEGGRPGAAPAVAGSARR